MAVVDKPAGWTSHQVVGRVRKLAGTRRVGHAGTLDPMATGVLVLGLGRATRLLGHLTLTDKAYAATVRLGQRTVTDDAEGEVVAAPGAAGVGAERVREALGAFRGTIRQVPSAVSAVKVAGVRSYARVRAGQAVELTARSVTVSRLDLLDTRPGVADGVPVLDVDVAVACSSGTYVRALARDLGATLGTGGHLTALRRTRVGPYSLTAAQTLEQAARDGLAVVGLAAVARAAFPVLEVDADTAAAVRHGRRLPGLALSGDPVALLHAGALLALYRPAGPDAVPVAVLAPA